MGGPVLDVQSQFAVKTVEQMGDVLLQTFADVEHFIQFLGRMMKMESPHK